MGAVVGYLEDTRVGCRVSSERTRVDEDKEDSNIEFMWECKQNNVELLFLPAHSSHVLQPLGLGTFFPSSLDIERKLPASPALLTLRQSRDDILSGTVGGHVQRPSTHGFYLLGG